jgi:hypothetical protein
VANLMYISTGGSVLRGSTGKASERDQPRWNYMHMVLFVVIRMCSKGTFRA